MFVSLQVMSHNKWNKLNILITTIGLHGNLNFAGIDKILPSLILRQVKTQTVVILLKTVNRVD